MPPTSSPIHELQLQEKLVVTGLLVFDTAWRIGSGKEGETMSDLGVVLDPSGLPVLPGSSLKGKLRSTCESLAPHLGMSVCLLNSQASGKKCVSDIDYYKLREIKEAHQAALREGAQAQLDWIAKHTCDVCKLFGSPVRAARLRCGDGKLTNPEAAIVQVRDGVVLDRDSHTAVNHLKYDYEVVAAGTSFEVRLDLDNPRLADLALLGAGLFEWHAGSSIGGFISRGLGRFHLEAIGLRGVDFRDAAQRQTYLTTSDPDKRLTGLDDWETYFTRKIEQQLTSSKQE